MESGKRAPTVTNFPGIPPLMYRNLRIVPSALDDFEGEAAFD